MADRERNLAETLVDRVQALRRGLAATEQRHERQGRECSPTDAASAVFLGHSRRLPASDGRVASFHRGYGLPGRFIPEWSVGTEGASSAGRARRSGLEQRGLVPRRISLDGNRTL